MATSTSSLHNKQSSPRTNSLGFAKVDCHTCVELHKKCDRKRPKCGPCLSNRRQCGGFAMDLMWKDPVLPHQSPSRPQRQPRARDEHAFKFVPGRPSKKRLPKQPKKDSARFDKALGASNSYSTWQLNERDAANESIPDSLYDCSPTSSASSITWGTGDDVLGTIFGDTYLPNSLRTIHGSTSTEITEDATQSLGGDSTLPIPFLDLFMGVSTYHGPIPSPVPDPAEPSNDPYTEIVSLSDDPIKRGRFSLRDSLPLQVTYQNLAQKYHPVLSLYNEQFCVVPLSHDCLNNPFRMRMDFAESFTFLLHAVLAISSHHLAKTNNSSGLIEEMQKHWCTAIRLFRTALDHCDFAPLLDTLLILINIESTQSAYGMSDMHLRGAYKLLRDISAEERCQESPRLRAQLAMLIWWDVTASLISRREPRLPLSYLDILTKYDDEDGWSFFTLNGCPVELVQAMYQLAKLAAIFEKTVNMDWTIFNRLPVDAIVDQVNTYVNYEDFNPSSAGECGVDVNARRNRFHCIEAWRHAILLYVARVFTSHQDPSSMETIDHHTRVIMDSTRCIPPTEPIQKQLLLPVFLAASEVGDDFNRTFVRQYCQHWSNEIHFYQFETVTALLEEVWKDWTQETRETYWWGIKTKHKDGNNCDNNRDGTITQELLLG